jgi:hypothetical protein
MFIVLYCTVLQYSVVYGQAVSTNMHEQRITVWKPERNPPSRDLCLGWTLLQGDPPSSSHDALVFTALCLTPDPCACSSPSRRHVWLHVAVLHAALPFTCVPNCGGAAPAGSPQIPTAPHRAHVVQLSPRRCTLRVAIVLHSMIHSLRSICSPCILGPTRGPQSH